MTDSSKASKKSNGFTDEERAAMRERAQELKADARRGRAEEEKGGRGRRGAREDRRDAGTGSRHGEAAPCDHQSTAPELSPKTWYGMPAYARDGNVVCFFQSAEKFKSRYATLGFSESGEPRRWRPCGRSPSRSRS